MLVARAVGRERGGGVLLARARWREQGAAAAQTALEGVLERRAQLLQGAPLGGRRGERTVEGRGELTREVAPGPLERGQPLADPAGGGGGCGAAHGVDVAERLVDDERQRVQIALDAHLAPLALLGRHVRERADEAGRLRRAQVDEMRHSEVAQLGLTRRREEDILRLEIAVDDAVRVRRFEAGEHLERPIAHARWRHRHRRSQAIGERAAGHVLHRQQA